MLVLLDLDFIEPSQSEWNSILIPVLEKDGSVRLVGDYSNLNEVTVPIPFVMLYYTEEVCAKLG